MAVTHFQCRSGALLLCLLVLGLVGCSAGRARLPRAHQGVLNLAGYDLDQRDPVRLDGEWSFYWGQLLVSEDFHGKPDASPARYRALPSTWSMPCEGYRTGRSEEAP